MTTMIRMFLLGTLVPLVSLDSAARDIFQSLVNIIDLFGIYHAINQTVGKPEIKVHNKPIFECFISLDSIRSGWLGFIRKYTINFTRLLEWSPAIRIFLGIFQSFCRTEYQYSSARCYYYSCLALDAPRY